MRNMSFKMDIKCFLRSVGVFAKDDSVVEGSTHGVHISQINSNDGKTIYPEDEYQYK